MQVCFQPIGHVRTEITTLPRHWSVSDVIGELVINPEYSQGLKDLQPGQKIIVLFYFHRSRPFVQEQLEQTPPHRSKPFGVFSICSPHRPNPIGLSVLEVLGVEDNIVQVKGLDMYDETPILDIKPHVTGDQDAQSRN